MGGPDAHRALAEALHACRARAVVSGCADELYDTEPYTGWHRHILAASAIIAGPGSWSAAAA
ncbi:hypothetical protein GCM10010140_61420 [Streptosporangium pseudovulgare]|uniref:Uncharacterized protein n=1 Tax=Streptosporangium pseudovulgare TaxID=35765 RepID=A0ABQ2RBP6_9ACTN|nr:hypothetical protein GCM10010140_61420 [Streptosporangium pseudovulgare]